MAIKARKFGRGVPGIRQQVQTTGLFSGIAQAGVGGMNFDPLGEQNAARLPERPVVRGGAGRANAGAGTR